MKISSEFSEKDSVIYLGTLESAEFFSKPYSFYFFFIRLPKYAHFALSTAAKKTGKI